MNRSRSANGTFAFLAIAIAAAVASPAAAQPGANEPHLAYAFPAGCRQGATMEIVLGGQHLKEVSAAYLAGGGVEAEIVKWYRPLTRGEFNQLRMALDEAREKLIEGGKARPSAEEVAMAAGITDEQLREIEIYRERDRDEKRQPNEQLEEELTIKLTVADDAAPGKRELRLLTETAISNPLWIHIGRWSEARETEPNDTTPDAAAITQFPVVVNGQIMPGETDSFSFEAKKGMRLVIVAGARDVIPYLADAVPGWFQAVLKLTDSSGAEVAYSDSFHFSQDPVIYFEVPRDGRYTVEIHDALYRGREDFVYRMTVGEIPFVTSVFPLGAPWDEKVTVQLEGWNLSQTTLETQKVAFRQFRPVRWHSVPQGDGQSVQVPVQMDVLREVFDREPNNDIASAQSLSARTIVNGRIDAPGDEDVFFVSGVGRLAIEVHARRHGSPLDSMVSVTDSRGKELAYNDDYEDKTQGFLTHHADSHVVAMIPASGAYVRLSDAQGSGGAGFVYRLYLRAPEPDFELRVTPATIVARAGAVMPITVHALRNDNFAEDIELALLDPPPGFWLSGAILPGNADHVQLTLTVPATPPEDPVVLEMAGRSRGKGNGPMITRPAVPAENMMQAFIWRHLVPVEDWAVIVSGKPGPKPPFDIVMPGPRILLPVGGDVYVPVRPANKNVNPEELFVTLNEPKGVTAKIAIDAMGAFAVKITTDAEKVEPGSRGNLLLHAHRLATPNATKENPNPKPWRTDFGYFPAIPFEIAKEKSKR
jgi:hypothetical protein